MKLIYDEKDRLSEILGSGENGSFKEGEMEFFTNYFNGLINTEKEVKIKALEEQKIKETEFYKQNTEVARANAESAKANAESNTNIAKANAESAKANAEANANIAKANAEANANIAKANAEASIASSNALVAFFTTVSVVALTSLALKKPELFENNAQPQNSETSPNPSLLSGPEDKNETNQSSKSFDPDERAKPVK